MSTIVLVAVASYVLLVELALGIGQAVNYQQSGIAAASLWLQRPVFAVAGARPRSHPITLLVLDDVESLLSESSDVVEHPLQALGVMALPGVHLIDHEHRVASPE